MRYKLRNLTYQPIRLIIGEFERLLRARGKQGETIVNEITDQIKNLEKKGLIKVRGVKD